MITASARLVRMPAKICGSAAGKHDPADPLVRAARRYERAVSISVGSIPRTPSIVFSSTGKMQKKRDERDLLRVADRVQQDDRDRQQRRRRHRAPVLDVRHRRRSAPSARGRSGCRSRRRATTAIAKPSRDPLEARDDVRAELREEPHVLELDEDRRQAAGTSDRLRVHRPELPGDEDRDRHGDLRRRSSASGRRARAHAAASVRCDGCQRSTRRSTAETAKWIATPRKPVASASA